MPNVRHPALGGRPGVATAPSHRLPRPRWLEVAQQERRPYPWTRSLPQDETTAIKSPARRAGVCQFYQPRLARWTPRRRLAIYAWIFHLPLDALGTLLVMFTTGYLLSSCSSGRILARINVGSLLTLSCLATAASLLGYALTPRWGLMVALGVLSGLGAGAIDAGVNTYAATRYSTRMVNWLHACYGIGATRGPVIMTGVLAAGLPWQWGYGMVGLGQLVLALCFGLTRSWWPAATAAHDMLADIP